MSVDAESLLRRLGFVVDELDEIQGELNSALDQKISTEQGEAIRDLLEDFYQCAVGILKEWYCDPRNPNLRSNSPKGFFDVDPIRTASLQERYEEAFPRSEEDDEE